MQLIRIFMCLFLMSETTFALEKTAETELGESCVAALAADDIVAYSQCWISIRRGEQLMKEFGYDPPSEELERNRTYFAKRNQVVAESFRDIQAFVRDRKIDRQTIRLKSCIANEVREKETPKGKLTNANSFTLLITAGGEEWKFRVDDGAKVDGM